LGERRTFDVRTAPIAMGAVNERLGQLEGALRSVHPTHSVVAIGPDAALYTAEHHCDSTPFGLHSPYYKLIKRHAQVLLLGATQNNVTLIHAIEDLLGEDYPARVYNQKRYRIPCIDAQGRDLVVTTPVHAPWASALRDCSCMERLLADRGALQRVPLGEAAVVVFDSYDYAMAYLDYLASGHSIYGRHRVTAHLLQRIQEVKEQLSTEG
ncbi:MAG: AAC(3) family N-acetyltransferase, partial [Muribaculaceae bacterium]|nr:AAC(3) family N-acetyltransferase [Muribaculaceae bacterium]